MAQHSHRRQIFTVSMSKLLMAALAAAVIGLAARAVATSGLESNGRRGLRQAKGGTSQIAAAAASNPAIPTDCINTGLNLQSSCTKELDVGTSAFGLSPNSDITTIKVNTAQLRAYLAKAPAPSAGCCAAAASFNNAYCSCSPAVLDLVKSFTNNDLDQYREISRYLSNRCKEVGKPFTLYIDNTCPKNPPKGGR